MPEKFAKLTLKSEKSKIGVLLLNLGTPDATDYWSMRRYLKEFLWDKRVIETPRILWWFILNFIILTFRPNKSGALYKKIWDMEKDDSPLRLISLSQGKELQETLDKAGFEGEILVDVAMRYGNPSTADRLNALKNQGCNKILLAPLYPQYSAPTTASANDKAFDVLKTMRWQPAIRTLPPYFDHPLYIEALAKSVLAGIETSGFEPEVLVTSYHGMPQSYVDAGDPYFDQCHVTSSLLAKKLGWKKQRIVVAFQSRFGPEEWLKPYTDEILIALAKNGTKNIATISPAFSVDCLETLEEIAMEGRDDFLENGGEKFFYIPCLNDDEQAMKLIETLVRSELAGWIKDK
ncbi:MAG: ferrochelatase [Devosiaceae bacterium]|nr:ferrochelatase [Devosiaceae bacterium]